MCNIPTCQLFHILLPIPHHKNTTSWQCLECIEFRHEPTHILQQQRASNNKDTGLSEHVKWGAKQWKKANEELKKVHNKCLLQKTKQKLEDFAAECGNAAAAVQKYGIGVSTAGMFKEKYLTALSIQMKGT